MADHRPQFPVRITNEHAAQITEILGSHPYSQVKHLIEALISPYPDSSDSTPGAAGETRPDYEGPGSSTWEARREADRVRAERMQNRPQPSYESKTDTCSNL